jgi:hypothetical protein
MRVLEKKRVVPLAFFMLLVLLLPYTTAYRTFPVGLILNYSVNDDIEGEWTEQYKITQAASVQGDSIFLIEVSSSSTNTLQGSMLLNSSSWELIDTNGTALDVLLQPPLWVETSDWHIGETVSLPTYSGSYHLSSEYVTLRFGIFPCWRVHSIAWFSIDDDYQQCSENWFFHHTSGILLKYTYELIASQHAIYSYRFSRELTESNFQSYGVLSLQDQTFLMIQNLGLVIIPFTIFLSAALIYRYFRSIRFRQTARTVSN